MKIHLIVALVLGSIFHILQDLDLFKSIKQINPFIGCEYINEDIPGAEDMVKYQNHLIFASGNLGKLFGKGTPEMEQAQFFIIINAKNESFAQKMKLIGFPSNIALYPHGLHIAQLNKQYYLFTVNHAYSYGGERIEIFLIEDEYTLLYKSSIIMGQQYTGTLKDLIVVSENRFLITKLMPYTDPIEGRKEWGLSMNLKNLGILLLKKANTYILDCQFDIQYSNSIPQCQTLPHSFAWAGGITWDGNQTVWVGDNLKKVVYQFKLLQEGLEKLSYFQVPHQIDNIHYEPEYLYISMTPKAYQTIALQLYLRSNELMRNQSYNMYSAVGKHSLSNNHTEILYQSNQFIRGISGGLVLGDKLYLTSWADIAPMVCQS